MTGDEIATLLPVREAAPVEKASSGGKRTLTPFWASAGPSTSGRPCEVHASSLGVERSEAAHRVRSNSGSFAMLAAMRRASSGSAGARLRHAVPSAPRLLYFQRREGSYSQRDTSTCGG